MGLRSDLYATVLTCLVFASLAKAEGRLLVTYSNKGLQQLSYKGVVLEDLDKFPDDTLHIFHMKMTDRNGAVRSSGQYGWGENNSGRSWDTTSHSWTYHFVWGSIRVGFSQHDESLNIKVTTINLADSGVILNGAIIYPLALHFHRMPRGFAADMPQLTFNNQGPGVTIADYGNGQVTAVVPDATKPIYSGFLPSKQSNVYTPIIGGTSPDGLPVFQPHYERLVAPGQMDTFIVSLRFSESEASVHKVAADALENWSRLWPAKLKWKDRRPIGSVYLASSYVSDDYSHPHGFPNNPRRYFNESDPAKLDVTTATGISAFQKRILRQATSTVDVLQRLKGQGTITWDIEGEEYPQQTSYVCQPEQIAEISPEMESVITFHGSPYKGMKLDDAYFKIIRDAGFRVGVCVRPQHFTRGKDGSARQVYLPVEQIVDELNRKIRYAHDRWGATLFYIDSTVDEHGAPLDASILEKVAAGMSDSLLIPEEHTEKYYAYTAPFQSFLFHGATGTAEEVFYIYPDAFSVNMVNDVNSQKLAAARQQLGAAVTHGDVLIVHGDYWDANNQTVVDIYREANGAGPAPPPPQ